MIYPGITYGRETAVHRALSKRKNDYTDLQTCRVLCVTWNVNGQMPTGFHNQHFTLTRAFTLSDLLSQASHKILILLKILIIMKISSSHYLRAVFSTFTVVFN